MRCKGYSILLLAGTVSHAASFILVSIKWNLHPSYLRPSFYDYVKNILLSMQQTDVPRLFAYLIEYRKLHLTTTVAIFIIHNPIKRNKNLDNVWPFHRWHSRQRQKWRARRSFSRNNDNKRIPGDDGSIPFLLGLIHFSHYYRSGELDCGFVSMRDKQFIYPQLRRIICVQEYV